MKPPISSLIVSRSCGVITMAEVKCPKGERLWMRYYNKKNSLRFFITSKETSRDFYFLYEVSGATVKKLGKARSPRDLEEKYKVEEGVASP